MARKTVPDREKSRTFDWSELRRRLETSRERLAADDSLAADESRRILRHRARELAREEQREEDRREGFEVVRFLLGYETYALESVFVREVIPLREYTPLPGLPPFILGIVNVRGRIVSVVDLRKFFELPEKGLTDLNKVIVLRRDAMEFGILADALLGTATLDQAAIQPSLPTLTDIRKEYLKGITAERVVFLDAGKLLADPKMVMGQKNGT